MHTRTLDATRLTCMLIVVNRQVAIMAGIHLEGEMLGPGDEDEDVFAPQVCVRPT